MCEITTIIQTPRQMLKVQHFLAYTKETAVGSRDPKIECIDGLDDKLKGIFWSTNDVVCG